MPDRGVYRGVYSALPDAVDFQALHPHARLVLLVARLCRDAGPAVIFRFYPEVLARQTGLRVTEITARLGELQTAGWIELEGPVLWIKNGLRYDPNIRINNPKHRASISKAISALPRLSIVLRFCDYYDFAYPFDRVPDRLLDKVSNVGPPRPRYYPNTEILPEVLPEKDSESDTVSGPTDPSRFALGPNLPPGFRRFWEAYPRRIGRDRALVSWRQKGCEAIEETVVAGLRRTMAHITRDGGRYVPNPATWLNQGRWTDEPGEVNGHKPFGDIDMSGIKSFVERHRDER